MNSKYNELSKEIYLSELTINRKDAKELYKHFARVGKDGPLFTNKEIIPLLLKSATLSLIFILGIAFLIGKIIKKLTVKNEYYTNLINNITGKRFIVYEIKTSVQNALKTFGSNDIFITSGCLQHLSEREIVAVLLHEIGHAEHHDILKNTTVVVAVPRFLKWFLYTSRRKAMISFSKSKYIDIFFYMLPFYLISFFGRISETNADKYVVKYGYANDLISFFEKLKKRSKQKLQYDKKHDPIRYYLYYVKRFFSYITGGPIHPDMDTRIENLKKWQSELDNVQSYNDIANIVIQSKKSRN